MTIENSKKYNDCVNYLMVNNITKISYNEIYDFLIRQNYALPASLNAIGKYNDDVITVYHKLTGHILDKNYAIFGDLEKRDLFDKMDYQYSIKNDVKIDWENISKEFQKAKRENKNFSISQKALFWTTISVIVGIIALIISIYNN